MGRKSYTISFPTGVDSGNNATGYIADTGLEYSMNGAFKLPADIAQAEAAAIATAVGGTILTEGSVCSDRGAGSPRRLRFIRQNGGSMSVPVRQRSSIIAAATAIKAILDAGTAGGSVVCIKLEGEEFNNLNDELGVNYSVGDVAQSHKTANTAPRQYYLTGAITYNSDVPFGNGVIQSIRSITNNLDAPASQVASVWTGCVGTLNDVACGNGRRNPRAHRRYTLKFITQEDLGSNIETPVEESIELPVAGHLTTDILTCGQNAAGIPGLICIGYKGESYDRVQRLL